jgi:hypothetical protein
MLVVSGVRIGRSRRGTTAVADGTHGWVAYFHAAVMMAACGRRHGQHGGVVADMQQGAAQTMVMMLTRWCRGGFFGRIRLQAAGNASLRGTLNLHDIS